MSICHGFNRFSGESSKLLADILIIDVSGSSNDSHVLSRTLVEVIHESESLAKIIQLEDVITMKLEKNFCIVLAEVDRPMLHEIRASDFEALKHVILQSAGVLWLIRGGTMSSHTPEANIFTGLSRSIRAENPGISLMTLDLDPMAPLTEETARDIFRLTAVILNTQDVMRQEYEYALRNGMSFISRLVPQKEMNGLLADQSTPTTTELLPFLQMKRPLKLEVGVPGL